MAESEAAEEKFFSIEALGWEGRALTLLDYVLPSLPTYEDRLLATSGFARVWFAGRDRIAEDTVAGLAREVGFLEDFAIVQRLGRRATSDLEREEVLSELAFSFRDDPRYQHLPEHQRGRPVIERRGLLLGAPFVVRGCGDSTVHWALGEFLHLIAYASDATSCEPGDLLVGKARRRFKAAVTMLRELTGPSPLTDQAIAGLRTALRRLVGRKHAPHATRGRAMHKTAKERRAEKHNALLADVSNQMRLNPSATQAEIAKIVGVSARTLGRQFPGLWRENHRSSARRNGKPIIDGRCQE